MFIDQARIIQFLSVDLKLAQMTLGRNHDTPLGHRQSLCEVGTSNVPL